MPSSSAYFVPLGTLSFATLPGTPTTDQHAFTDSRGLQKSKTRSPNPETLSVKQWQETALNQDSDSQFPRKPEKGRRQRNRV